MEPRLTTKQAAEHLGCAQQTMYEWVKRYPDLRAIRRTAVGGKPFWLASELDRWRFSVEFPDRVQPDPDVHVRGSGLFARPS